MGCEELRDDRLAVLYGEADEEIERRVRNHHAECASCREEFAAFEGVRRNLAAWPLPAAQAPWPARHARPARPRLRIGLAAAAGLLLAAGAALRLAGASFEYRSGPIALRLGPPAASTELLAQEQRHRREMEELRSTLRSVEARLATSGRDADAMRRIEQLVRESEDRQGRTIEARLASFEERTDAQRRYDLARISAGLSYLDGKTGQHVARTTELMGYMLQASQPR
jgi:hypothetical protein